MDQAQPVNQKTPENGQLCNLFSQAQEQPAQVIRPFIITMANVHNNHINRLVPGV
jgi:hypothetical protein